MILNSLTFCSHPYSTFTLRFPSHFSLSFSLFRSSSHRLFDFTPYPTLFAFICSTLRRHLFDSSPTFVRLFADICPTLRRHLSDSSPTFVRLFSDICSTLRRHLSDSLRHLSNSSPTFVRLFADICPTVHRHLSDSSPTFVRLFADTLINHSLSSITLQFHL